MNGLVFSDIDRTITPEFTLFPVYDALAADGFIEKVANERVQDTYRAFEAREIDYRTFMTDALEMAAEAIKGRGSFQAKQLVSEYVSGTLGFYLWVPKTFDDARGSFGEVVLVTGEPDFIAEPIARRFGASYFSTQFGMDTDGTYTGDVVVALGSAQKASRVKQRIAQAQHERIVYVFGDSAGDIGMLDLASTPGNAFCIRPDDELRAHARTNAMTIVDDPNVARSLLISA